MPIVGQGYVGLAKETTFGTAVAPSTFLPVSSFESSTDPQNYYPEQIKGNRSKTMGVPMGKKHEASIEQDAEPNSLGFYLLGALGAVATTQPDAAGAPTAYQHIFTPANTLPSFTFERYETIMMQTIAGAKFDSLSLSIEAGSDGVMKVSGDMLAKSIADKTGSAATTAYTDKTPFIFSNAIVEKGGAQNDNLKSFEMTIANNLKDDHYTLTKSRDVSALPEGMREVTFSIEMYFTSKTDYNNFMAGTTEAFKITVEGALIGGTTKEKIVIELPKVLYDTFEIPMGGADDEIMASIEGTAVFDTATAAEVKVTLVNTKQSY